MQGPAKMRNEIINAAYAYASNEGLAALSIRAIAKQCSVSVGTIYNYFPDKAALITEVITKFWRDVAFSENTRTCLRYQEGENLLVFCERLFSVMNQALEQFRNNWLGEVSSFDARTRQKSKQAENEIFEHVYHRLEMVIRSDVAISSAALDAVEAAHLARLIWTTMYQSLRTGDTSWDTLKVLMQEALY